MSFILTIAAAILAFFCGRRYSDWISEPAIDHLAAEVVRLKAEVRTLHMELMFTRSAAAASVMNAYRHASKLRKSA